MNYGGIKSASYILGITLADWLIFSIPSFLFTSLIWILDIEILKGYRAYELFGAMMMFGFGFIGVNIFVGFSFKDTQAAMKTSTIYMLCFGIFIPWG